MIPIGKHGLDWKGTLQTIYVNQIHWWVRSLISCSLKRGLSKTMLLIVLGYLFVWLFVDSVCAEWHERKCHWHRLTKCSNSSIWKYSGCKVQVKAKLPGAYGCSLGSNIELALCRSVALLFVSDLTDLEFFTSKPSLAELRSNVLR